MKNKRVYIRKKPGFNIDEKNLLLTLQNDLNLLELKDVQKYLIYDVFQIDEMDLDLVINKVFSEINTDDIFFEVPLNNKQYIATETLPNQFDERQKNALECIRLLLPLSTCKLTTGELYVFEGILDEQLVKVKQYLINEIENREKNLNVLELPEISFSQEEEIIHNFREFTSEQLQEFLERKGLSMSLEDLLYCQEYYIGKSKDPILGELKIIDTYWSDHCRHKTFNTILENIKIEDKQVLNTYSKYLKLKETISKDKPISFMDLATIYGKYALESGFRNNIEKTKEDNAISTIIEEDNEKYLLQFKNETHNHPTEIEPFGGAATCIGGAIRDPLSGRAYVYQGMRISGSANILEEVKDTLPGKLPQRIISQKSSDGFSSYGNQIGLATTFVKEIYHPGYKAKHLEAGAVIGVVKQEYVTRATPQPGDVILLLGGDTGFDGIGGATGSSKSHNENSKDNAAIEVQKGNAPEERKIQRLFTNKDALKMIKKSNDFGAGGISVAIGELADGVNIQLDAVPLKVQGLKPSDIALSESQERMAVVLSPDDVIKFQEYAMEENVKSTVVAFVTSENKMQMYYKDELVIDLDRDFLDTGGRDVYQDVVVENMVKPDLSTASNLLEALQNINIADNINMETKFDATVGATTVLMPYGGKYQLTKNQVSVQKIPFLKHTTSHVAYGYNPYLFENNPYEGSKCAVLDSITKLVVSGVALEDITLSFQEYFQRLYHNPIYFGKVLSALLGAFEIQQSLKIPALGGKDSMSGTYKDLNVPPTLISFAFGPGNIANIISSEIKSSEENIYVLDLDDGDLDAYKKNVMIYRSLLIEKKITSAYATSDFGIAVSLAKMLLGNKLGASISTSLDLYTPKYGQIIFTSPNKLDVLQIGTTTSDKVLQINDEIYQIENLVQANMSKFDEIFIPIVSKDEIPLQPGVISRENKPKITLTPHVFIPVFPGTNSEFEMKQAFEKEGCTTSIAVFKNNNDKLLEQSLIQFVDEIKKSDIVAIPGGFSGADQPDGSGKYIVNFLSNAKIKEAIHDHLDQDKLILGICNGFQALIKSGLITTGKISKLNDDDPTLFKNDCNFHISKMVNTKVLTNNSPWLKDLDLTNTYTQVISHGEGKLVVGEEVAKKLFLNDQVAFYYASDNPNGSNYNIEGLISPCGKILGKMAHSERYQDGLYQNIPGEKKLNIFKNAVNYFKGEQ